MMAGDTPIDVVTSFIRCFNENRIADALDHLGEDVFYHNIPMAPVTGRAAVEEFMAAFDLGGSVRTRWDIVSIAGEGDIVLTERVDYFFKADGPGHGIAMMGSFRVRNGRIVEWRDYFDLGEFERLSAALSS